MRVATTNYKRQGSYQDYWGDIKEREKSKESLNSKRRHVCIAVTYEPRDSIRLIEIPRKHFMKNISKEKFSPNISHSQTISMLPLLKLSNICKCLKMKSNCSEFLEFSALQWAWNAALCNCNVKQENIIE